MEQGRRKQGDRTHPFFFFAEETRMGGLIAQYKRRYDEGRTFTKRRRRRRTWSESAAPILFDLHCGTLEQKRRLQDISCDGVQLYRLRIGHVGKGRRRRRRKLIRGSVGWKDKRLSSLRSYFAETVLFSAQKERFRFLLALQSDRWGKKMKMCSGCKGAIWHREM